MVEFSLVEFRRGQPLAEYVGELLAAQPDLPVLLEGATPPSDVVDQFRANGVRYAAVVTEPWCPDSLHAIPLLVRLQEGLPELEINVWKRSADLDLARRIAGEAPAVPHVAFRDADFRDLGHFRERPATLTAHLEEESRHFRTRLRMQERERVRAETLEALLAASRGDEEARNNLDGAIAEVRAALQRLAHHVATDPALMAEIERTQAMFADRRWLRNRV